MAARVAAILVRAFASFLRRARRNLKEWTKDESGEVIAPGVLTQHSTRDALQWCSRHGPESDDGISFHRRLISAGLDRRYVVIVKIVDRGAR